MNIQETLTQLTDEECAVLTGAKGSVIVDNTDIVGVVDGTECVFIRTGEGEPTPVPTEEFNDIEVMNKFDFVMSCLLGMCG